MTKKTKTVSRGTSDLDNALNQGNSPIRSALDDHSSTSDPYDVLISSYSVIKKEISKKHKKSYYYGVVLSVDEIDHGQLALDTSETFQRALVQVPTSQKTKAKVYVSRVYISEIHGFLPLLNRQQVSEFKKMKKQIEDEEFPPHLNSTYDLFEKTLSRITPFYCVGQRPSELSVVKVEFEDSNDMFYGKYLEKVSKK